MDGKLHDAVRVPGLDKSNAKDASLIGVDHVRKVKAAGIDIVSNNEDNGGISSDYDRHKIFMLKFELLEFLELLKLLELLDLDVLMEGEVVMWNDWFAVLLTVSLIADGVLKFRTCGSVHHVRRRNG